MLVNAQVMPTNVHPLQVIATKTKAMLSNALSLRTTMS